MPANKNEIKFRNAVRKAGVPLAAKNDRYFPSLYIYQIERFLDADGQELHYYDVHYKSAEPVWFTFTNLNMYQAQKLHAAGFEFRFEMLETSRGKATVGFYKAPVKADKK